MKKDQTMWFFAVVQKYIYESNEFMRAKYYVLSVWVDHGRLDIRTRYVNAQIKHQSDKGKKLHSHQSGTGSFGSLLLNKIFLSLDLCIYVGSSYI